MTVDPTHENELSAAALRRIKQYKLGPNQSEDLKRTGMLIHGASSIQTENLHEKALGAVA